MDLQAHRLACGGIEWGKENTKEILTILKGEEPRVSEDILWDEVEKIPLTLFTIKHDSSKIPSKSRRASFRKFGEKWLKLPEDLQIRVLQDYDRKPVGYGGAQGILDWLFENLNESWGLNDVEQRMLRTVRNGLDGFDGGMRTQLALDAGRFSESHSKSEFDIYKRERVAGMAYAATLRGRKAIGKSQQILCKESENLWKAVDIAGKSEIVIVLGKKCVDEVKFSKVWEILLKEKRWGNKTVKPLIECVSKLDQDTKVAIEKRCELQWGKDHVGAESKNRPLGALDLIFRFAGRLGSSPPSNPVVATGQQKTSQLVFHLAWLMVLAGYNRLPVSETGKLAVLLDAVYTMFPDDFPERSLWRENIEDALGCDQDRMKLVDEFKADSERLNDGEEFGIRTKVKIRVK